MLQIVLIVTAIACGLTLICGLYCLYFGSKEWQQKLGIALLMLGAFGLLALVQANANSALKPYVDPTKTHEKTERQIPTQVQ